MTPSWDPYADLITPPTTTWADSWLTADERKGS